MRGEPAKKEAEMKHPIGKYAAAGCMIGLLLLLAALVSAEDKPLRWVVVQP